ncbi:MAG: acyl-CoA thioesterase [Alphaproteobacteria bacterium]
MRRSLQTRRVNFADCDPARIVFYPRYFEWFDRGTEMLFRSVGLDWEAIFATSDWNGVPLLDANASFKRPCRFGDTIELESWIEEWRGKTFLVRHEIRNKGELAVDGRELRAWTVVDKTRPAGLRAEPVPAEIIARFQA